MDNQVPKYEDGLANFIAERPGLRRGLDAFAAAVKKPFGMASEGTSAAAAYLDKLLAQRQEPEAPRGTATDVYNQRVANMHNKNYEGVDAAAIQRALDNRKTWGSQSIYNLIDKEGKEQY